MLREARLATTFASHTTQTLFSTGHRNPCSNSSNSNAVTEGARAHEAAARPYTSGLTQHRPLGFCPKVPQPWKRTCSVSRCFVCAYSEHKGPASNSILPIRRNAVLFFTRIFPVSLLRFCLCGKVGPDKVIYKAWPDLARLTHRFAWQICSSSSLNATSQPRVVAFCSGPCF